MFPRISSSSFLIGYRSVCSPKSSTQSNYHNCSCVRQRSLAPVRIDDMRMPSNPFAQSRDHFAEVETGLKFQITMLQIPPSFVSGKHSLLQLYANQGYALYHVLYYAVCGYITFGTRLSQA